MPRLFLHAGRRLLAAVAPRNASKTSAPDAYDPLVPPAPASRILGLADNFTLWFSLGMGLLVLQAGAFLAPGFSLPAAVAAVLVGTCAGVAMLGAAGVVGADTGLSAIAGLRPALGVRGAALPAVLNVVQLTGWGAFEIVAMRDAASALARDALGFSNPWIWTLLVGVAVTGLSVMGPLSVVRRLLRGAGVWLLLAGAAWLTWRLLADQDLAALWARPGAGGLSFAGGVDLVAAMPLSWLPLIADYSRFGRSPGAVFKGSTVGYLVANVWFYLLGYCYVAGGTGGSGSLVASALAAAGGGAAIILILIDETDNAFADVFSAASSAASLLRGASARLLAVAFGILCTLIALFAPLARFESFLLLIGSLFAPLFGVLLADHFVLRRRRILADQIDLPGGAYWFKGGWRVSGLAAWAAGVAAYQAISRLAPAWGATLPAVAVAAAAYLLLGRTRGSRFTRRFDRARSPSP